MTDRMIIGQNDGTMLCRIVGPGYSAANRTHPAVFDSRNEYLKLHAVCDITLTKWDYSSQRYYQGEYHFADLGYVPYVFCNVTPTTLGRVFYPNDQSPSTSEMNNFFQVCVSSSGIWVSVSAGVGDDYNFRFRALIFKNPLASM